MIEMNEREKKIIEAAEALVKSCAQPGYIKSFFSREKVENLEEAVNLPNFKKGQLVMVRDENDEYWIPNIFKDYKDSIIPYKVLNIYGEGIGWEQCRYPTEEEWEKFKNGE